MVATSLPERHSNDEGVVQVQFYSLLQHILLFDTLTGLKM